MEKKDMSLFWTKILCVVLAAGTIAEINGMRTSMAHISGGIRRIHHSSRLIETKRPPVRRTYATQTAEKTEQREVTVPIVQSSDVINAQVPKLLHREPNPDPSVKTSTNVKASFFAGLKKQWDNTKQIEMGDNWYLYNVALAAISGGVSYLAGTVHRCIQFPVYYLNIKAAQAEADFEKILDALRDEFSQFMLKTGKNYYEIMSSLEVLHLEIGVLKNQHTGYVNSIKRYISPSAMAEYARDCAQIKEAQAQHDALIKELSNAFNAFLQSGAWSENLDPFLDDLKKKQRMNQLAWHGNALNIAVSPALLLFNVPATQSMAVGLLGVTVANMYMSLLGIKRCNFATCNDYEVACLLTVLENVMDKAE